MPYKRFQVNWDELDKIMRRKRDERKEAIGNGNQ
jgi:hypothetical protein